MSFVNDADFQDDFRRVGEDATAGFEAPGEPSEPTEYASSENLGVAAKAGDAEDDDLEDDEDEEDLDEEDDDDLDDEDLDDEDEDEDEDDDIEDDDEDEEEEDEDDDDAVKARLGDAEARARAS